MRDLSVEDFENPDFDMYKYILDLITEYFLVDFAENQKSWMYDVIHGEGAYEEFIFGGGAGL